MDLSAAIAKQLGVESDEKGIVIVNIEPGAPADEAGLRRGDVINEINRQHIANLNDFNRIIARIKAGDNVLLLVNRGGRKFYSAIERSSLYHCAPGSRTAAARPYAIRSIENCFCPLTNPSFTNP